MDCFPLKTRVFGPKGEEPQDGRWFCFLCGRSHRERERCEAEGSEELSLKIGLRPHHYQPISTQPAVMFRGVFVFSQQTAAEESVLERAIMHLKSYPKLVRSELRLDVAGVQTFTQQSSSLFVSQQGALRRSCSSNHGNISSSRLPFSVLSTNTLRCGNATNGSSVATLRLKASSSAALQPPGRENDTLRLHQTATEDADAPLDIWTVIKPGHVREKIAIFASDVGRTEGIGDSERTSTSSSGSRDRTLAACTNNATMSGLLRAVKAKGSWEEKR
ncbi:hypothetical protein L3Q82_008130 [Scortum barcoo]|uniref:Uncharacterized protein n=1 Tax=Scortum barcoo TaxID=214431 RepID=A0ACB8WH90_9TELE|nr:hypothetical protein L3Q82_008130 [Scortum barcoo]